MINEQFKLAAKINYHVKVYKCAFLWNSQIEFWWVYKFRLFLCIKYLLSMLWYPYYEIGCQPDEPSATLVTTNKKYSMYINLQMLFSYVVHCFVLRIKLLLILLHDSRFKSIYSTMYRHQSYKSTEQCEKNKSNISWWVHVWRPSLRPYGRYHKGHQRVFGSTGRIKVSRYDSNNKKKD